MRAEVTQQKAKAHEPEALAPGKAECYLLSRLHFPRSDKVNKMFEQIGASWLK